MSEGTEVGSSQGEGGEVRRDEIAKDKRRTTVALSTSETVSRYGSANAEFIKGYTGIDNETGRILGDGLRGIQQKGQGLAQKAGVAAEVRATNKANAEKIISKSSGRIARTDDFKRQYGGNHPIADIIHFNEDGSVAFSQMKFEGDHKGLVSKIVREDGDYRKYLEPKAVCEARAERHLVNAEKAEGKAQKAESRGKQEWAAKHRKDAEDLRKRAENNQRIGDSDSINLEVPSEQVEKIKQECRDRARKCLDDARSADESALKYEQQGNLEAAAKSRAEASANRQEASRCEKLENNVTDAGLTQEEANQAATQAFKVTASSILKTSHRAGVEGAKIGATIGSTISILTNAFAIAQEQKSLGDAAKDMVLDTVKAGGIGYATAFTGSAIKGAMQQSGGTYVRALSRTNAPALAVQVVLSLGSSVSRYVQGEIDEAQFLGEVGEKGAGMLSGAMFAALGQIAIPVPFVGAAVGSMIGYTLSSMFYQSALGAARAATAAKANLARVTEIETAARVEIEKQRVALDEFMRKEFPELERETRQLFAKIARHDAGDMDAFAEAINSYAELLGAQLQFKNQVEFDQFMATDEPLRL